MLDKEVRIKEVRVYMCAFVCGYISIIGSCGFVWKIQIHILNMPMMPTNDDDDDDEIVKLKNKHFSNTFDMLANISCSFSWDIKWNMDYIYGI